MPNERSIDVVCQGAHCWQEITIEKLCIMLESVRAG